MNAPVLPLERAIRKSTGRAATTEPVTGSVAEDDYWTTDVTVTHQPPIKIVRNGQDQVCIVQRSAGADQGEPDPLIVINERHVADVIQGLAWQLGEPAWSDIRDAIDRNGL